jgi:hypothetical protein
MNMLTPCRSASAIEGAQHEHGVMQCATIAAMSVCRVRHSNDHEMYTGSQGYRSGNRRVPISRETISGPADSRSLASWNAVGLDLPIVSVQ